MVDFGGDKEEGGEEDPFVEHAHYGLVVAVDGFDAVKNGLGLRDW